MGAISSVSFWYFLLSLKPVIAISPVIIYDPQKKTFRTKIANISERQVVEIQIRMTIAEMRVIEGEQKIFIMKRLELQNAYIPAMSPVNKDQAWGFINGVAFSTKDDPENYSILLNHKEGERRIVITLSAIDAFSGSRIVKRASYRIEDVRIGRFENGLKFISAVTDNDLSTSTSKHSPLPLYQHIFLLDLLSETNFK